jgi:hypothetical protein
MKPGSLVVVLKVILNPALTPYIKWYPADDEKTIYTVREIYPDRVLKTPNVLLEEGIIGYHPVTGDELAVGIDYLREVQSPDDLTAILEEALSGVEEAVM